MQTLRIFTDCLYLHRRIPRAATAPAAAPEARARGPEEGTGNRSEGGAKSLDREITLKEYVILAVKFHDPSAPKEAAA